MYQNFQGKHRRLWWMTARLCPWYPRILWWDRTSLNSWLNPLFPQVSLLGHNITEGLICTLFTQSSLLGQDITEHLNPPTVPSLLCDVKLAPFPLSWSCLLLSQMYILVHSWINYLHLGTVFLLGMIGIALLSASNCTSTDDRWCRMSKNTRDCLCKESAGNILIMSIRLFYSNLLNSYTKYFTWSYSVANNFHMWMIHSVEWCVTSITVLPF